MNINQNINKLLLGLKLKGQFYRINSFQFYSEKNDSYSVKYQVLKKEKEQIYNYKTNEYEWVEKYNPKETFYKKVDLMIYLAKEYKEGGASGETN